MKRILMLLSALVIICVGVAMIAKAAIPTDVFSYKAPSSHVVTYRLDPRTNTWSESASQR
ncbi:MAG: hypothetical protein FD169_1200 [Bacillota bacterium]|nr:MAG: hypothetical protein FD169_1200 [Bacillota bacterium]